MPLVPFAYGLPDETAAGEGEASRLAREATAGADDKAATAAENREKAMAELAKEEELAQLRISLLRRLELEQYARAARLTLDGDAMHPPPQLIASGRVLALSVEQLRVATPQFILGEQPAEFELHVLRLLARLVADRLDAYEAEAMVAEATGAEATEREGTRLPSHLDDEHLLASGGSWRQTSGVRCAIHVRTGERRILLHWLGRLRALSGDHGERVAAGGSGIGISFGVDASGSVSSGGRRSSASDSRYRGVRRTHHSMRPAQQQQQQPHEEEDSEGGGGLLHSFAADATGWDINRNAPLWSPAIARRNAEAGSSGVPQPVLEVRQLSANDCNHTGYGSANPADCSRRLRGVIAGPGSRIEPGQLLGCYTGRVLGPFERANKRVRSSGFESYCFPVNATHVVDPTDEQGQLSSDTPHSMALVNEPSGDSMPNVWPMDYRYGACRDRELRPGVPYYAAREIAPGEELVVCYGATFQRATYRTTCSDATLLARWTELQKRVLPPLLHW